MFALVQWSAWCVDTMHHTVHKVVKRMGGQTSKAHGARGVHGVRNFLIAKNAPQSSCKTTSVVSTGVKDNSRAVIVLLTH